MTMRTLQKAKKLQKARGDTYLGVDVLLCSSLGDPDVKQAIAEAGLSPQQLETAVQNMRGADSKARLSTVPPRRSISNYITRPFNHRSNIKVKGRTCVRACNCCVHACVLRERW